MARIPVKTKWRMVLYWIRKNFPASNTVSVRRVPANKMSTYRGTRVDAETFTYSNSGQFYVQITREMSSALLFDALIHEWAHILTWDVRDKEEHSAEWGVAYARIYRDFWRWDFGRGEIKVKGQNV